MPAARKPKQVLVRTYQVGFGDCFLLTFDYAKVKRHILIDFGSTKAPPKGPDKLMLRVAEKIREDCGGHLDAVIATHRHKDHISGFATTKNGKGSGNIIAALDPDIVIQPWTEDPDAAKEATGPAAARAFASARGKKMGLHAFIGALGNMNAFAEAAVSSLRHLRRHANPADVDQIDFIGDDNIANRSAVENLIRMARRKGAKGYYVKFGDKTGLDKLLPGVKVHVLGPPSVDEWDDIKSMTSKDEAEYWHLQSGAAEISPRAGAALFPRAETETNPIYARWFKRRLIDVRGETTLGIVRMLDDSMNNTSLILLFEVGDKVLLFPGDAQIENWRFALDKKPVQKLLSRVTLYKVGHHGSLNATPKSMWNMFKSRGDKGKAGRLKSILSTLEGVHGEKNEVPRGKLVTALKEGSDLLLTTQSFEPDDLRKETLA